MDSSNPLMPFTGSPADLVRLNRAAAASGPFAAGPGFGSPIAPYSMPFMGAPTSASQQTAGFFEQLAGAGNPLHSTLASMALNGYPFDSLLGANFANLLMMNGGNPAALGALGAASAPMLSPFQHPNGGMPMAGSPSPPGHAGSPVGSYFRRDHLADIKLATMHSMAKFANANALASAVAASNASNNSINLKAKGEFSYF